MSMRTLFLILTLLTGFSSCLLAKVVFPSVLGDYMVLQQQAAVNLWGTSVPLKKVCVFTSWNQKTYTIKSDKDGNWNVKVQTPAAGGPYKIIASDGERTELNNILIGEVWLCSGQSNMEMPVRGFPGQPVDGAADLIAKANPNNNIRFITIQRAASRSLLENCKGEWEESTPETVGGVSATAYWFAQYLHEALQIPIGLICASWSGSKIQPWLNKETIQQFPEVSLKVLEMNEAEIRNHNAQPTLLYNAMIHPIRRYTMKGVIWYQGEGNRNEAKLYRKLFPAMVSSWRKEWGQGNFPFYYVQIAPFANGDQGGLDNAWLRQVQSDCLEFIPNAGMAVISDTGLPDCVHPSQKDKVGKRLALWALAKTYYRKGTPYASPIFQMKEVKKHVVVVTFANAELGLTTYGQPLTGFELAGEDGNFHPAKAKIISGQNKVVITSEEVQCPLQVRFGFRNYQLINLYNTYGLPAAPFTTEVLQE